jgi:hypothetical protein
MGLVYAEIGLRNPKLEDKNYIIQKCLVDTGALHLCIPKHVQIQLQLDELNKEDPSAALRVTILITVEANSCHM